MNLADLFVEFKAVGGEAVQRAVAGVSKTFAAAGAVAKMFSGTLAVVGAGVVMVSQALERLGTAGQQSTVELNRYNLAWQQLTREIANVFVPATDVATAAIQGLARYIREIPDDQFNAFANAFATARQVILEVYAALRPVFDVVVQIGAELAKAFTKNLIELAPATIAVAKALASVLADVLTIVLELGRPVLNGMVAALTTVAGIVKELAERFERIWNFAMRLMGFSRQEQERGTGTNRRRAMQEGGGFADIRAIYDRVQAAVMKLGMTPEERSAKSLESIDSKMGDVQTKLKGMNPGLA